MRRHGGRARKRAALVDRGIKTASGLLQVGVTSQAIKAHLDAMMFLKEAARPLFIRSE